MVQQSMIARQEQDRLGVLMGHRYHLQITLGATFGLTLLAACGGNAAPSVAPVSSPAAPASSVAAAKPATSAPAPSTAASKPAGSPPPAGSASPAASWDQIVAAANAEGQIVITSQAGSPVQDSLAGVFN